ncbi:MAG: tetratricopeptide repeat protein [Gammaproteobacteria bacterium]|nr:tetratricopeptide repeat protein [Gammaproteobacteria bacterium]
MTQALVFEVGESGFDKYVIENSRKAPVLVEFMGMWSEPCIVMADAIHSLAQEFAGQFVFAKVDIDEQAGLRDRFGITNMPTLLVFQEGAESFRQEGEMQAAELRLLLKGVGVFSEADELRQQARTRHLSGDTAGAIVLLAEAIKKHPGNTQVAMDMVQIFIDIGETEQAAGLFNRLPDPDKNSDMGKSLIGQLTFAALAAKTEGIDALTARLAQNVDDHDARFDLAVCQVAGHDYNGAMDSLFGLLELEPGYKNGAAREMIITVSSMLAPNDPERAAAYRQRLASLLN